MTAKTGSGDALSEILANKGREVRQAQAAMPLEVVRETAMAMPVARGFAFGLSGGGVIAEIKFASPSAGRIWQGEGTDSAAVSKIAAGYAAAGARCLSVLTDRKFFSGHNDYIGLAKSACNLPVLRKDFTITPWQVWEARMLGADAILLIVAALQDDELVCCAQAASEAGVDVLIEVHNEEELKRVLALPELAGAVLGVNNRDLRTLVTDVSRANQMVSQLPSPRLVVGESGYSDGKSLAQAKVHGIHAFLIGEALMRQADPETALRQLFKQAESEGAVFCSW